MSERFSGNKDCPELCNDCGFTDFCPAEGECVRARLRILGFDTGMPIDDAREIVAAARQSAIIEPPTPAELRGELNAHGVEFDPALKDGFTCLIGAPIWRDHHILGAVQAISEVLPGFFEVRAATGGPADVHAALMARAGAAPDPEYLREARNYRNELVPGPALRKQLRAAIAEIEKAQPQIAAGIGAGYTPDPEMVDAARTAANVLEALPEAIAHAFGLTIRTACNDCGATLFKDEPYITNADGKPICEACCDTEAA